MNWVRATISFYLVMVRTVKQQYFSGLIAFMDSCPAVLFKVTRVLLGRVD